MTKDRLEAFSDGVIAIIITIMVLELQPPHGTDLDSLRSLVPVFLSYVLSWHHGRANASNRARAALIESAPREGGT
jgi:hypothetical protein